MSARDTLKLLLLSTLWGMSFIFMRVASPEFGVIPLILVRMGIGALLLLPLLMSLHYLRLVRDNIGKLALLGIINHVIPFSLLALATLQLEAGFTSLINATTPIFTALIGALWFATAIRKRQYIGLATAFVGIYILSGDRLDFDIGGDGWFILSALGATLCYGFSANYSKTHLGHLPVRVLAAGSCSASGLILLIPGLMMWPETPISGIAWSSGLALAVLSTAVAFLLFFGLLARVGATATSTVTFLVPISALLWGYLLLDEVLTLRVLIGMAITLGGTAVATGMLPQWKRRRETSALTME